MVQVKSQSLLIECESKRVTDKMEVCFEMFWIISNYCGRIKVVSLWLLPLYRKYHYLFPKLVNWGKDKFLCRVEIPE